MSKAVTSNVAFDSNEYNKIGMEGTDVKISAGRLIVDSNVTITGNVEVDYVFANNNFELINLAPNGNQSNYNTGVHPSRAVTSVVYLKPVHSSKITGISTTGWDVGKVVTIRNDTTYSNTSSDGRLLIFEVNSTLSTTGNRFITADKAHKFPIFLMPQDEIRLMYDGSNLHAIGGSRQYGSTNGNGIFDEYQNFNEDFQRNYSGASWYISGEPNYDFVRQVYTYFFHITNTPTEYQRLGRDGGTVLGKNCILDFWRSYIFDYDSQLVSNTRIIKIGLMSEHASRKQGPGEANTPQYSVCWAVDTPNVPGYWITETSTNTGGITQTQTVVGANSATNSRPTVLGYFINGTGSQVDFFYSLDERIYEFTAINHTTNIPVYPNTTFETMGSASFVAQITGSNKELYWAVGTHGTIGMAE